MSTLFENQVQRPLADRLRPAVLDEVVGQDHLLSSGATPATDGALRRMLSLGMISSLILWGPPGTGKTTIARLLADHTDMVFEPLSAVFSGVADLRKVFDRAKLNRQAGRGTLLFIDEIHRFNRSQQDGFLPYVEDGTVVLVGATTENPSFELNAALLSRCQVLVLNRLDDKALESMILRAEVEVGHELPLTTDARGALRAMADGDGRYLLNLVEILCQFPQEPALDVTELTQAVHKRRPLYDKSQDGHYNLISALHKSLRGSDTDAALYWFERMVLGGEDIHFIARRLVRFSVEDIGLADPNALNQAMSAWQAYDRLGSPEGELAIVQCIIYLATAPKSNAAYKAEKTAKKVAKETGSLDPPKHILNAPTGLMKDLGYGDGYEYDHNTEDGFSGQNYFPENMRRARFFEPGDRGFEREIAKRIAYWEQRRMDRQESKK